MTDATWLRLPNRACASPGACRRFAALLALTLAACGDRTDDARTVGAHEGVACAQCHVGTTAGGPVAQATDAACSACHEANGLAPQVTLANVTLRHADHPRSAEGWLRCGECHVHEGGEEPLRADGTCFLCHADLPQREPARPGLMAVATAALDTAACRLCHVQPTHTAFLTSGAPIDHASVLDRGINCLLCHYDIVEGSGQVADATCRTCHGLAGGPPPLSSASSRDAESIHEAHRRGGAATGCTRCHEPVDHGVIQLASSLTLECARCHAAGARALRQPIDSAVHRSTQALYAGFDPHHPDVNPSVHFLERVACTACHADPARPAQGGSGAAIAAIDAQCTSCHGPRFAGLVAGWVRGMRDNVATVGAFVRAAAVAPAVRQSAAANELAARAARLWQFVDSAGGVHNVAGADAALRRAANDALAAFDAAGTSAPGRPRLGPAVTEEPCMRCHYGVEGTRQEVFAQSFDHGRHVIDANLPCAGCHSRAELFQADGVTFDPAHGATPITATRCAQCHHVETRTQCETCHTPPEVAAIEYVAGLTVHVQRGDAAQARRVPFAHQAHASVRCTECHAPGDPLQTPAACTSCHAAHHEQAASPGGCAQCHPSEPLPSHRRSDHLECGACHAPSTLQLFGSADRAFCLQCHRDMTAHRPRGECVECHLQLSPDEAMRTILGARQASRVPSP